MLSRLKNIFSVGNKIINTIFSSDNKKTMKKFYSEVSKINQLESKYSLLSNDELKSYTQYFKNELKNGKTLEDIKYEAFAVVREASKRIMKMKHFDCQILGGLILNSGAISEMKTGEGKTLTATLPAYLNALDGKGVHIITMNDYLAKRDGEWMKKLYDFLGLSVGYIINNSTESHRKKAYNADITYATNNELGFDFLRDNMQHNLDNKVQRAHHYALVDEVDSILIDESRTPLIISGPVENDINLYMIINNIIQELQEKYYEIDEKVKSVILNDEGITKVESLLVKSNVIEQDSKLYDVSNMNILHHVNQSLKAIVMFKKDKDYVVKNNQIIIIDEFTGRTIEGRRYSEGLHQAIEAKEYVPIQNENQTLASITFQNYFRIYKKLSGMTGTAITEVNEFKHIYNLDVIEVPSNVPIIRKDYDDEIYSTKKDKNLAISKQIKECYNKGQPVLVGTVSIEKSEEIANIIEKEKIPYNILNAKHHEKEAYIISKAGKYKAVTIATNMAGRGTDIMLGGNPEMLINERFNINSSHPEYQSKLDIIKDEVQKEKEQVIDLGGLYIIGTERHESRRIDNQLRGRSGRQGDPGETKFFLSLEDDLMRIFASSKVFGLLKTLGLKDGEAITHPMITRALENAQTKVEGNNFEIRKNILKFDDVMNQQRNIIFAKRNDILQSESLVQYTKDQLEEVLDSILSHYITDDLDKEEWPLEDLIAKIHQILNIELLEEQINKYEKNSLKQYLLSLYNQNLESKFNHLQDKSVNQILKQVMLTIIDHHWKEHLYLLDNLKQSISLRSYGQKDPLHEYKKEALVFFENMFYNLSSEYIQKISFLSFNQNINPIKNNNIIRVNQNNSTKINRNSLCHCGSNKKYKHCHGKNY